MLYGGFVATPASSVEGEEPAGSVRLGSVEADADFGDFGCLFGFA